MLNGMIAGFVGLLAAVPALEAAPNLGRERISFNEGWRFEKGDPVEVGGRLGYANLKPWLLDPSKPSAPEGGPYAETGFDDRAWRSVTLPHDWGIEGPFHHEYPGETGKLPWWGVGWYRKRFNVPATDAGRPVYLDFDGAMSYASVWLNGRLVGGHPYGYASFRVDLTPYVRAGAENVVAVRLDNPRESSRWYPGGGIYRNVWLVKTAPLAVNHWGVTVTTPVVNPASAMVAVRVDLDNRSQLPQQAMTETKVYDGRRLVGILKSSVKTMPFNMGETAGRTEAMLEVTNPRLWSPASPSLYRALTTIRQDGKVVDTVETTFGIRKVEFNAQQGILLNGQRTYLKGVCLHHDQGALGAAFNTRAAERQLEILKAMGCNAIRTSHNPPAPEFLDLCDRMGFLVLDELTDTWTHAKKPNGYAKLFADWSENDLRSFIRRDRNHPSVILWSTGNEIAEQVEQGGQEISRRLTAIAHDEDPTRLVTSGNDRPNSGFNGYQNTIDVFGYNYKPRLYARFRQENPTIPLYGSETASTISSRGEYFFPVTSEKEQGHQDFQVSSYDLSYPAWASTPDMEFKGQDENPSVFGEFVWTGFDYLGEPTPYNSDTTVLLNYSDPAARAKAEAELKALGKVEVPSRSSYFGIVDLAGFPKDRYYLYQARWRPELPMAHLLPHWNWPERVGLVTPVHLYTSGDEAELFLNGRSLGRKKRGPFEYRLRWDDVVYEPGELRAVVYKGGKPWATDTVRTTGAAAKLTMKPDRRTIGNDGRDLSFVTVTVADAKGVMMPRSKNRIQFEIEGPGEIVATDNGDATDHESFQAHDKRAYNGLCLVIVRAKKGEAGTIRLRAISEGLKPAEVTVRTK
jgi:beta-galactosidase